MARLRRRGAQRHATVGSPEVRRFAHTRPGRRGIFHSVFPERPGHSPHFTDLPPPRNQLPFHLKLETVVPSDEIRKINNAGSISFHAVGDTGGYHNRAYQDINASAMEEDFSNTNRAGPLFFYHLGDIVYQYGEADQYYDQFYEPYEYYNKPIFAIAGNHDGMTVGDPRISLEAFVTNFCASQPEITRDAQGINRDAMTQPYVYWTLEAPLVTIVGLYSNTDEYEGHFEQNQIDWFINELKTAPKNKALIIAVHHPAYSGDKSRGSSKGVAATIDNAISQARRAPDLVLSGHVHNYQRFTRLLDGQQIPYIVAGAGGYPAKHFMLSHPNGNRLEVPFKPANDPANIVLENYNDTRFGYLILRVDKKVIEGQYIATAYHNEASHADPEQVDSFELDWQRHKLTRGGSSP